MATRRQFTSEFKLEVIKMVIDQGARYGKLSQDLSINENLIRRWVKHYQLELTGLVSQGTKPLTSDQQRIRELERENQSLKSDVELLKKRRPSLQEPSSKTQSIGDGIAQGGRFDVAMFSIV
jgi:transposase